MLTLTRADATAITAAVRMFDRHCRKHMEADHANRPMLEQALQEVERIAAEVNDRVAAEEKQRRIFDVYELTEGG